MNTDAAHGTEVWQYQPQPGRIRGGVFNDTNANGQRDDDEVGLAGWRVFLDTNGDGLYMRGEASVLTDAGGRYAFDDLPDGRYAVAITPPQTYTSTTPSAYGFRLAAGKRVTRDFGVRA